MTTISKTLEGYIKTLPLLGSFIFLGGVLFAVTVLNSNHPDDWSLNYFFLKTIGIFFAYLYIGWWNPGGRVTLNFDKSSYSADEKALYDLVAKYKSNLLILFPVILYIIADFMVTYFKTQSPTESFEGYFTSIMLGAFVGITLTLGVKYLSAWWNIRKHL